MATAMATLVAPSLLCAAAAGELSSRVNQLRNLSDSLGRRSWDNAAETGLVDGIDRAADTFHDLAGRGTSMTSTAVAVLALMESAHERYAEGIEAMQAEVIRRDGNLEEVQDSAAWREREMLAMRLLYRINWVRYEIAMRYERSSGKRKVLLERARDGFAQFLATGDRQLTIESLLGHGLTSKALRNYDAAINDFNAALRENPDAQTVTKLRLSLAEIYVTRGKIGDALMQSKKLIDSASGDTRNQTLFLRSKVLLLAIGKYRHHYKASTRGTYRAEAANTLERLYKVNSYWRGKVIQLIDAGIEDPLEWAAGNTSSFVKFLIASSLRRRGQCDEAVTLYNALLEQGSYESESYYGTGFCAFHEGQYQTAIERLSSFLDQASGNETFLGQAAYLRFKAAESLYLRDTDNAQPEVGEPVGAATVGGQGAQAADSPGKAAAGSGAGEAERNYIAFLKDFLDRAAGHANAYEAWFRLGEWYRGEGQLLKAAEAYGKVEGDPAFRVKAGFQSAQSYFEAIIEQSKSGSPDPEVLATALDAIDGFVASAEEFRKGRPEGGAAETLTAPLMAKATVMGAAIAAGAEQGMQKRLQRLEGFEERFAGQADLFGEITSLRIVAHRRLGDLEAAGVELEKLLAMDGAGGYQSDALKKLGVVFLKEAATREENGDFESAKPIKRVALRIYERLLEHARREGSETPPLAGLEQLIDDLRRQIDG